VSRTHWVILSLSEIANKPTYKPVLLLFVFVCTNVGFARKAHFIELYATMIAEKKLLIDYNEVAETVFGSVLLFTKITLATMCAFEIIE
jgi:hypothetical protein